MAQNQGMSDLNEAELLELITKPLTAEEMAQYQDVLDSASFQQMVRQYHLDTALNAMREMILGFFEHQVSLEAMLIALANVWIDRFREFDKRLDAETEASWRQMPELLIQILLQQVVEVLNENRLALRTDFAPELEELYARWKDITPRSAQPITDEADQQEHIETQIAQAMRVYEFLSDFRGRLEKMGFVLDGPDYLELWSLVMIQTFLFAQEGQEELYYLIQTNWNLFLERLSDLVTLMLLLKGFEELLLPENRQALENFIASEEFDQRQTRLISP